MVLFFRVHCIIFVFIYIKVSKLSILASELFISNEIEFLTSETTNNWNHSAAGDDLCERAKKNLLYVFLKNEKYFNEMKDILQKCIDSILDFKMEVEILFHKYINNSGLRLLELNKQLGILIDRLGFVTEKHLDIRLETVENLEYSTVLDMIFEKFNQYLKIKREYKLKEKINRIKKDFNQLCNKYDEMHTRMKEILIKLMTSKNLENFRLKEQLYMFISSLRVFCLCNKNNDPEYMIEQMTENNIVLGTSQKIKFFYIIIYSYVYIKDRLCVMNYKIESGIILNAVKLRYYFYKHSGLLNIWNKNGREKNINVHKLIEERRINFRNTSIIIREKMYSFYSCLADLKKKYNEKKHEILVHKVLLNKIMQDPKLIHSWSNIDAVMEDQRKHFNYINIIDLKYINVSQYSGYINNEHLVRCLDYRELYLIKHIQEYINLINEVLLMLAKYEEIVSKERLEEFEELRGIIINSQKHLEFMVYDYQMSEDKLKFVENENKLLLILECALNILLFDVDGSGNIKDILYSL